MCFKRIKPSKLHQDDRIIQLVQELQRETNSISGMTFDFDDDLDGDADVALPLSQWEPLLHELATRETLEKVRVSGTPKQSLMPLFRYRLFQALQRNPCLRSLHLHFIDFSTEIANCVVSFLDDTSDLENLTLKCCTDNGHGNAIAVALKRNKSIRTLNLMYLREEFRCALFQSLASDDCKSQLKHLIYQPSLTASASVSKFLQLYLVNPATTVESFELRGFPSSFSIADFSNIVQGLIQSKSVRTVSFKNVSEESVPQHLVNLIRSKANLSTLELLNTAPLRFSGALAEVLGQRRSTLEHLIIRNVDPDMEHCYQALLRAIPSFKIAQLTLSFRKDVQDKSLLDAIKKNYSLRNVWCQTDWSEINCLSNSGQARLEFYLTRNQKLAQWATNPLLVPRTLWPQALKLSLEAGEDSLYLCLQALSGHAVGRERARRNKRKKRSRYHDASPK